MYTTQQQPFYGPLSGTTRVTGNIRQCNTWKIYNI